MVEARLLAEMTWPDVERQVRVDDRLIVVTGATEQHGHHLPLGTDTFIPGLLARRLSQETGVVVVPPIPIGMSELHMAFPGTLTFTQETVQTIYLELVQSAYRHGWRRFFVLNGHGGNRAAWNWVVALATKIKPDVRFILTAWWQEPDVIELSRQRYGRAEGHAGLGETAGVLAYDPGLVRLDAAIATAQGTDRSGSEDPDEFRRGFPNGAVGERPGDATAEFGEELIALLVNKYTQLLEEWPPSL